MTQILAEWTPEGYEKPSKACSTDPETPVVLDFGSCSTRIGLASSDEPEHVFQTRAARFRDRKSGSQQVLVGNDVLLDSAARAASRSPFDGPLLTNWDAVESVLDYAFKLVRYKGKNPVAVSEPLFAPILPHRTMQELLFEGYSVPKLAFGADVLGSAAYHLNCSTEKKENNSNNSGSSDSFYSKNCLVVCLGNEATTVLPVIDGKPQFEHARRINFGGRHAKEYMHALLVLKYPTFPSPVSALEVEQIVKQNCFFASDYKQFARTVLQTSELAKHERILQAEVPETPVQSSQELELQQLKRQESGKRLQLQAQAARAQKLADMETELQKLHEFESRLLNTPSESLAEAEQEAHEMNFDGLKGVQKEIKKLTTTLKKARGEPVEDPVPDTSLLSTPDEELSAEELQLKRRQRLLKASYDARQRAKAAKAAEREKQELAERKDVEWRQTDLQSWSDARKQLLKQVLVEISEREKLKTDSRQRFKNSLDLVAPKRQATASNAANASSGDADDMDIDADEIENEDEVEGPRDLDAEAAKLKGELLEHDPSFDLSEFEPQRDWRNSTVHKFLYGNHPFDVENLAQQYQINISIERARVVEPLFDPSMVGLDQAGLTETCLYVLNRFPQLSRNIKLSGGFAEVEGLANRLEIELRRSLPTSSEIAVQKSQNPGLDPWRGIAHWASNSKAYVSREKYAECGPDYIQEHLWGNPSLANLNS